MSGNGTIGYAIDHKSRIEVYCGYPDCNRWSYVDLEALAARLGREHSTLHDDIVRYFHCQPCRDAGRPKKIGFIHHVNLKEANGSFYDLLEKSRGTG